MRSSISKNFSPPQASRCSATSSGCCAHSLCAAPRRGQHRLVERRRTARSAPPARFRSATPDARACSSKRRISSSACRRSPATSTGDERPAQLPGQQQQRARRLHQRVEPDAQAACSVPPGIGVAVSAAAPAAGAAGRVARRRAGPRPAAAGARSRRAGLNGSSMSAIDDARLSRESPRTPSPRPGNSPATCRRHAARGLELLPQLAGLIELEVDEAGVKRNLPRRDRHGVHRHARQLQVHQVADLLDRPDLELRREAPAQLLGRQVGARRQDEHRRACRAPGRRRSRR